MRTLADPTNSLGTGLTAIRAEFGVPGDFPPEVLAAADAAARQVPSDHVDRTAIPFVTLDPAASTDLDQAFAIEARGGDLLLHYAIADVAWFVEEGGAIDHEAWRRGETLYLPDGKASLHPPVLAEGAASLLPEGDRPALVLTSVVGPDGIGKLESVERALIRSRAKLAYETATAADLPAGFGELTDRILAAEARRGASRVDPPEQEVVRTADGYDLHLQPRREVEDRNAALSLVTNLAVADALLAHRTGLFRVMAAPDAPAIARLRHVASALGLIWPVGQTLDDFQRTLSGANPAQSAFMLAIRRAGHGAEYAPYRDGVVPWHAAMAASYAQATAPLRRLADRYVLEAALAVANGQPVPDAVTAAFERLPATMARADALAGRVDRAVVDLAETVLLQRYVGETFAAVVIDTDDHGARIQLRDQPVVARIADNAAAPGAAVTVRLVAVDSVRRTLSFVSADGARP